MKWLIDHLSGGTPLGRPVAAVVIVIGLFLAAWVVSRVAQLLAARIVDRAERRRPAEIDDSAIIVGLRQRETAISLIATTVRYVAFGIAIVLSIVALSGGARLQTLLGASFFAVVLAFAAQRFLTDVVAGLLMFFEGWFRIGDTVAIDAWKVLGVVEAASLRSLTIRSIQGEIFHVPNSQVQALRVIPRGYRHVELEFFATDLDRGRELVDELARLVPVGPTRFIRRPAVVDTETLDPELHRVTAQCVVAVGREWLAEDLLPTLTRERAAAGLLVHGPIVTFVDEDAARSFARVAAGAVRRPRRAAGSPPPAR